MGYNGNLPPTFRCKLSVPSSRFKQSKTALTLVDGTDKLNQNAGNIVPFYAAWTDILSCVLWNHYLSVWIRPSF